mgnify:CR=1 FL=1
MGTDMGRAGETERLMEYLVTTWKGPAYLRLTRQNLPSDPAYLRIADSMTILKRMYRNLIHIHSSRGNREEERQLRRHLFILENAGAASP